MDTDEIRSFRRDLRSLSQALARQVEICCCSDVTPAQCHALLALEESGPVPNGELAALLQVDASTLSRTIDQLEKKDLVVRQPHPTDRRATLLVLSDQGGEVATAIHGTADVLYRGILGKIPADRRGNVLQCFTDLVEAFRGWQTRESGNCNG